MYNKDRNHAPFKTPSTDPLSQWKEKNQGLLKYAGDRAKKSINAGLEEAPDFMRDADEGTSFENVQNASVKRRLANDVNDSKLYNSATMEMIGHLSKANKGPYLKAAQPLQKYIDVKDEFDFKHNNYTTTENVDKTPDEKVRQLQRELNEAGYTDKFGQKLKEDGIYAGKTAYADDMRKADNTNSKKSSNNTTGISNPLNTKDIVRDVKEAAKEGLETTKDIYKQLTVPLSSYGVISPDDEKRNKLKKTMIKCLSANWHLNDDYENRDLNSYYANKLRKYDDNSFNRAILLNKKGGANGFGHNAVMLLNKDSEGLIFSFYSTSSDFPDVLGTFAEMRFAVLDKKQVNQLLYGDGSFQVAMAASDHSVKTEQYDRFAYFDLPKGGYNMYHTAINLYDNPGVYAVWIRQCDDIACKILLQGGVFVDSQLYPNLTYDTLFGSKWTVKDNIKRKEQKYEKK